MRRQGGVNSMGLHQSDECSLEFFNVLVIMWMPMKLGCKFFRKDEHGFAVSLCMNIPQPGNKGQEQSGILLCTGAPPASVLLLCSNLQPKVREKGERTNTRKNMLGLRGWGSRTSAWRLARLLLQAKPTEA